jgi:hypothetical protein
MKDDPYTKYRDLDDPVTFMDSWHKYVANAHHHPYHIGLVGNVGMSAHKVFEIGFHAFIAGATNAVRLRDACESKMISVTWAMLLAELLEHCESCKEDVDEHKEYMSKFEGR